MNWYKKKIQEKFSFHVCTLLMETADFPIFHMNSNSWLILWNTILFTNFS